jgi:flagellar basal body-associated protein FliL
MSKKVGGELNMNKKKIIQIGIIIFVIVFVTICVAIVQFSKHNLEEAKKAADYFVNSKWEHKYHLL